jgi:hypothetical protein
MQMTLALDGLIHVVDLALLNPKDFPGRFIAAATVSGIGHRPGTDGTDVWEGVRSFRQPPYRGENPCGEPVHIRRYGWLK